MLRVAELDAGYGDVQVLWGIGLEIGAGEIVALLGANGAGKSTLLATISGLLEPRRGGIAFEGEQIGGRAPEEIVARGIAHVPQGRRLFGGLTVLENLLMGAYRRTDGRVREDLDRVFALFPILQVRQQQLAGRLSGGEQQMCALGRGLMSRPKLLLIDELSLGLAPLIFEQLLGLIAELRSGGVTIGLVEQDVLVALELADRAYVLETGRVALSGTARELAENPHIKTAYLGL